MPLSPALVERVLERLGFSERPAPDAAGLAALYAEWCQRVSFDNVRKLLHLASRDPGPLPGDDAEDFFRAWLACGAGGTCWAVHGALHALLEALGFRARRVVATMLVTPDLPPNHGSVAVELEGERWLVDGAVLHGEPLRLADEGESGVEHPAWGVRCARRDGAWHVRWRPLHDEAGLDCRLDELAAPAGRFRALHEQTRGWSPFNFSVYARRNRADGVLGAAFGRRVEIGEDGRFAAQPLDAEARLRLLVDELGIAEAVAARLPPDAPLPPPPDSRTGRAAAAAARSGRASLLP